MSHSLAARARSLLFVPGHKPERFEKALAAGSDMVIIDLEDAVAPQDKAQARGHIASAMAQMPAELRARVLIRINAADAPDHAADLAWLLSLQAHSAAGIVVPKAATAAVLAAVGEAAGRQSTLLPLIESAEGWKQAYTLAQAPNVCRLVFGHLDFQLDMGMESDAQQSELLPVRLDLVAASRRAGIAPPVDGVSTDVTSDDACRHDSERSRRLGFGGKLCIHPRQVPVVHTALSPSQEEIDWARRVLRANESAQGAVFQLDGRMVDAPVLRRAERLLATASPF